MRRALNVWEEIWQFWIYLSLWITEEKGEIMKLLRKQSNGKDYVSCS